MTGLRVRVAHLDSAIGALSRGGSRACISGIGAATRFSDPTIHSSEKLNTRQIEQPTYPSKTQAHSPFQGE
jgi:hypothetical protein